MYKVDKTKPLHLHCSKWANSNVNMVLHMLRDFIKRLSTDIDVGTYKYPWIKGFIVSYSLTQIDLYPQFSVVSVMKIFVAFTPKRVLSAGNFYPHF